MAGSDTERDGVAPEKSSPEREKKKEQSDASSSPRTSKHHYSRSRSRSRERRRKSVQEIENFKLKNGYGEPFIVKHDCSHHVDKARRHESKEKSSKKHKSEDHNDKEHSSDKGRDSLNSSENGEERHKRKERKSSRGRSHSRSRSRERLERAKKLQEQREKEMVEKQKQQEMAAAAAATGGSVINVAALLASGTQVTPQIAMAAQMAALQAKALAETGIAVPSYYNPAAVNPMKFAEQEKKRKMLWQGKKEGDKSQSAEIWEKLNFGNKDQNVKFRKLMGIKSEDEAGCSSVDEESYKTLKQQEEVFRNLDAQYEMARSQTHTQRGMGLGFTSSMRGMDAV
ncbi:arginine and serine rich coiled-coil 2 [Turdus rufiventris]|nr:arginine and serine rich coiled-coil 2 [Turdus rufiventris]